MGGESGRKGVEPPARGSIGNPCDLIPLAVAVEAGVCKPGNVCPERAGKFDYVQIVEDSLRVGRVCEMALKGAPLGLVYKEALEAQRSTLTGFVILAMPLVRYLHLGTEAPRVAVVELKKSETWEAKLFLKTLASLGITHFKRVEGEYVDANKWYEYEGNLWSLFNELAKTDHLFREVVSGYALSVSGAKILVRKGISADTVRELQRKVLSEIVDSLVARRHGYRVALELVKAAREGFHEWVIEKYSLNPGTAADIIATSLLLALAEERR